jgi:DNA-binding XRE family transcriptional regulator
VSLAVKPLGELLSRLRLDAGLTQAELARRTGVKREYLSSVELGRIGLMYPGPTNDLKRELGVPGWMLLEAMGYETDANDDAVLPMLVAALRRLRTGQQLSLLLFLDSLGNLEGETDE